MDELVHAGELPFLKLIREHELSLACSRMPEGARVLEIGAGAGWQSKALSERGFRVEAIDVPDSSYVSARVWPVTEYDGRTLPFGDAEFDVVYSSNVLEHVAGVSGFQREIMRVLKPGGLAVHVLPSATWRLWTTLVRLPYLVKSRFWREGAGTGAVRRLYRSSVELLPTAHGVEGTWLTEQWRFSRFHWNRFFRRTGWAIVERKANGLFYTGHGLFGSGMGMRARRVLSRLLGSTCHIYVVEPKK